MRRASRWFLLILLAAAGCGSLPPPPAAVPASSPSPVAATTLAATQPAAPAATSSRPKSCPPTHDDEVSPSYKPDAPVASIVGHGHVLRGIVRTSLDCSPIVDAKLELWPELAGQGHPDAERATLFTDMQGAYRFECSLPEHIHMRISAPGYHTIGVNSYHPEGRSEGVLDIVLSPQ